MILPVIADTGPLIGLARIGRLDLLHALYGTVFLPPAVLFELRLEDGRPGASRLREALGQGRLLVENLQPSPDLERLRLLLDPGEAEAILVGLQSRCRFLLIDVRKGRRVARHWGLPVVGLGGLLLAAKQKGQVDRLAPVLDDLGRAGYRLSAALVEGILRRAEEG